MERAGSLNALPIMKTNIIEAPMYALMEDQFVRVDINIVPLGPQESALRTLAASLPTNMPNLFSVDRPGGPLLVHAQSKDGLSSVWTELKELNIRAVYTVQADGSQYPLFTNQPRQSPPEHETSFRWNPALAKMRLFYVGVFAPPGRGNNNWIWKVSYLLARAPGDKVNRRPPLPNLFSDARICMGTAGHEYGCQMPILGDAFMHGLDNLQESQWNADANGGVTGEIAKTLFLFDKDGKQVPSSVNWTGLGSCIAVNNIYYGELQL